MAVVHYFSFASTTVDMMSLCHMNRGLLKAHLGKQQIVDCCFDTVVVDAIAR